MFPLDHHFLLISKVIVIFVYISPFHFQTAAIQKLFEYFLKN